MFECTYNQFHALKYRVVFGLCFYMVCQDVKATTCTQSNLSVDFEQQSKWQAANFKIGEIIIRINPIFDLVWLAGLIAYIFKLNPK